MSLERVMQQMGLDQWGVCGWEQIGTMLDVRAKNRIPVGARRVIVILFGYYIGDYPDRNLSRYAIVDDYHSVILQKLEQAAADLRKEYPNEEFIPFVDNSPIPEVRAAVLAGLGEAGRNHQLLNPIYGSRCFIGELVTTAAFPISAPMQTGICLGCNACISACPTGALTGDCFDKNRCRSHITQKKGVLSRWESQQIQAGGLVWGCDCCTDACPVNQSGKRTEIAAFYRDIQPVIGYDTMEQLCATKAYGWRGAAVLRRNLDIISGETVV